MSLLTDAAEIFCTFVVYAMATYFAFRTVLWLTAKHDDWLTDRRIQRETEHAKRMGYPTLLDVAKLRRDL